MNIIRKIYWRWKLRRLFKSIEDTIVTAILKKPGVPLDAFIDRRRLRQYINEFIEEQIKTGR